MLRLENAPITSKSHGFFGLVYKLYSTTVFYFDSFRKPGSTILEKYLDLEVKRLGDANQAYPNHLRFSHVTASGFPFPKQNFMNIKRSLSKMILSTVECTRSCIK
jgi:hypothetical protein